MLVLCDVLGFPASETAEVLGTSPASVNSALLRARRTPVAWHANMPLCRGSAEERSLVDRFVEAFERVDVDEVVSLLTEDARFAMPPEPIEFRSRTTVGEFIGCFLSWARELKLFATRANGRPAVGYCLLDPTTSAFRGNGLMFLDLRQEGVSRITRLGGLGLLARFDLPPALPS